ncbi:hypothetical protein SAMN05443248_3436 [Bradyrhizobium erythrophlei]|uniref:Uncharacterized protein n=1 Tax=Bradyrhizobium erythrophlei TaxID=1437360 RepID=A0A1M5PP80_9BRAD|nr:hypothetical protein SAMN05443248_3436 [Bradyrhizobium erythrophlei]
MVFWLLLIVTGANGYDPVIKHIGNYTSLTNCQNFAMSATYPVLNPNQRIRPVITMICVQAKDAGSNPPQDQQPE